MWSEVGWRDFKRDDKSLNWREMKNGEWSEMKWSEEKWREVKTFGGMCVLPGTFSYVVVTWVNI